MIRDALTVMWKEGKELIRLRGSQRGGTLGIAIFLCVFGIFLPLQMGMAWVDYPMVLIFWIWVPLFLVASVVADSFAGERERHTLETLLASRLSDRSILFGKIGAALGYGWGLTLISLFLGCVTVNAAYSEMGFVFYEPSMTLGIFLWSFLGGGLAACAGVLVSLRAATARQAQQALSITIMLLLFVPVFGFQTLPEGWRQQVTGALVGISVLEVVLLVSGIMAAVNLVLLKLAMSRFRRARLILD